MSGNLREQLEKQPPLRVNTEIPITTLLAEMMLIIMVPERQECTISFQQAIKFLNVINIGYRMDINLINEQLLIICKSITMDLAQYNTMGSNYIQVFDDRLRRIVEECYEVAFIVCNNDLEEFSSAKIFDVFSQTFPTAYVLNTGYWPFYSTIKGQCLCVCGRFGIPCRHLKSDFHWIDIAPVENDSAAIVFHPKLHGHVYPQEYQLTINSIFNEGVHGCNISALINVQYRKNERGRPRHRSKSLREQSSQRDVYDKVFNITLYAGYHIRREFYPAMFTIVFQPSPFFHEQYSSYFKNLKQLRAAEFMAFAANQERIWYITCQQMATSTFMLQHVNVALYKLPTQMMVYYPYYIKPKGLRAKRNKSCQTTEDCLYKIGESKNIWNYYADPPQPISNALVSLAATVTKNAPQSVTEKPFIIENSESYDNQWPVVGYNRVIKPNHSDNRPSRTASTSRAHQAYSSRSSESPSYAVPSTSKSEPDSTTSMSHARPSLPVSLPLPSTSKTDFPMLAPSSPKPSTPRMDFAKALRGTPGGSDRNDSSVDVAEETVVKTEIDEEFDLIETVILEDVMKKEEDWWDLEADKLPGFQDE